MNYRITYDPFVEESTMQLPSSKSLAARMLVIDSMAERKCELRALPDCDDTRMMLRGIGAIARGEKIVDLDAAGTCMRFLTALAAATPGSDIMLTGIDRLLHRPLQPLVDALVALGADIEYTPGLPPHIRGCRLRGGRVEVDSSISSQFISALLMVAPTCSEPLTIALGTPRPPSLPYILMTCRCMAMYGVGPDIQYPDGNMEITVYPGPYEAENDELEIEADWSAASYIYELTSLHARYYGSEKRTRLPRLLAPELSFQGDSILMPLYTGMGVATRLPYIGTKHDEALEDSFVNMDECPDLIPAMAVNLCLLDVPFVIVGAQRLRLKECDRVEALIEGLRRLGYEVECNGDMLEYHGMKRERRLPVRINPHGDHRMAMAFAPAAAAIGEIIIEDAEVVSKSFDRYYEEMSHAGLNYENMEDEA